jgi:two-component system, LuxR family, response regulator FixJ
LVTNEEAVMIEVFIVDDDPLMRAALSMILSDGGLKVTSFADGESFLDAVRWGTSACVLIDMHLPGCSGLELLKALDARQYRAPIFAISGRGDIPMAVDAIRNGALDFIEKPFDPATVAMRVRTAIQTWQSSEHDGRGLSPDFNGHERLTGREWDVLERITRGASNKETGRELAISPRTVEVHRARIMEKLGAKNAADLMGIVLGRKRLHRPVLLNGRHQSAP